MVKVIKYLEPKAYIFENVKGLVTGRWTKDGQKGEIFQDVLTEFSKLNNYLYKPVIIKSKDYGIPQNRPRLFIIGIRKDINFNPDFSLEHDGFFPKSNKNYPDLFDLLSDLIDPNYKKSFETLNYISDPKNDIQKYFRYNPSNKNIFLKGDKLSEQQYSKHSLKIEEKFQFMIENQGNVTEEMQTKKFSQRLLPKKWSTKGPTITATSLPDDFVHFSQPRSLTVREWARIQTFPDWYQFSGKRTTGGLRRAGNPKVGNFDRDLPKYTQIGNAVPVHLAYQIGKHLIKIINN